MDRTADVVREKIFDFAYQMAMRDATLQKAYYDQLFEHYEITDTIFQENMNYYTYHPDVLERVMDSVMNRFIKAQQ